MIKIISMSIVLRMPSKPFLLIYDGTTTTFIKYIGWLNIMLFHEVLF